MSQYAAEPVPAGVDPELAEYLMRQFIAIQYGVQRRVCADVRAAGAETTRTIVMLTGRTADGTERHIYCQQQRSYEWKDCSRKEPCHGGHMEESNIKASVVEPKDLHPSGTR